MHELGSKVCYNKCTMAQMISNKIMASNGYLNKEYASLTPGSHYIDKFIPIPGLQRGNFPTQVQFTQQLLEAVLFLFSC